MHTGVLWANQKEIDQQVEEDIGRKKKTPWP
jgi:hypothetical protein